MKQIKEILTSELSHFEESFFTKNTTIDIVSGFANLDKCIDGFNNGELVVMASRLVMGKTALMVKMAYKQTNLGKSVVIYSLKENTSYVIALLLAFISGVEFEKIQSRELISDDNLHLKKAFKQLKLLPLFIEDKNQSVEEIAQELSLKNCTKKIDMVYFDDLQFLTSSRFLIFPNRAFESGVILKTLKKIARDNQMVVYVNSTLSSKLERREGDKKPRIADFSSNERESIIEYADKILFLWRGDFYGLIEDEFGDSTQKKAKIIVAKNKYGFIGEIDLSFNTKTLDFSDAVLKQ